MRYDLYPQLSTTTRAPRNAMSSARPLLACVPLLALAACDVLGSDERPLHVEGTVVSAVTKQPVAGAKVEIGWGGNLFVSATGRLPPRTTDAQGRFTARIDRMEGYAWPNCTAAGVTVTAAGYAEARAGLDGPREDPACNSGRTSVSVELTPVP